MSGSEARPKAVMLVGPTAVGKTAVSLDLAERTHAEIVSLDSRLFYRGMDIGTAKPTLAERARVRHHLIDVADPDENWNLSVFLSAANAAIDDILSRGRLPLLVGGTGQFVRALREGWSLPPLEEDGRLRAALEDERERLGAEGLHGWLARLDPAAAAAIDARNVRRTIRALEVILRSGRRFSAQRKAGEARYDFLVLALRMPREELYARIDARIDAMFAAGFLDEVRRLLELYPAGLRSFSAIGYPQAMAVVQGRMNEEEAKAEIKRLTRVFVRRQGAWFQAEDPQVVWIDAGADAAEQAQAQVRAFMGAAR